jgi:hypothetical protein
MVALSSDFVEFRRILSKEASVLFYFVILKRKAHIAGILPNRPLPFRSVLTFQNNGGTMLSRNLQAGKVEKPPCQI